jgi:hypothetical protein
MDNWFYALSKEFGAGESYNLIASSLLLSIILFFYILNLASFIQPTVYPLIDRVTYVIKFSDKHFINSFFDYLIITFCTLIWFQISIRRKIKYFFISGIGLSCLLALYFNFEFAEELLLIITFPTILLLLGINKILKKNILYFNLQILINFVSLFAIGIGMLSAFLILYYILFPELSLPPLNYLHYFYLIIAIFSPLFLIVITFSFPSFLLIRRLKIQWGRKSDYNEKIVTPKFRYVGWKTKIFHLSLVMVLSITISFIPQIYTINKDSQTIGVDTEDYTNFLKSMDLSTNLNELFHKAFTIIGGDRPLTLLFFYFLYSVYHQESFSSFLENLPLLLSPLLIASAYFLTLSITKNHLTSIFASLITIPSHILIGIYGGLYANWFALIWEYLAILFLFKLLDEPKRIELVIFSIILSILILSHTPTWTILLYVIGSYLILNFFFIKRRARKKNFVLIFFSIMPSIIIDIFRMLFINTSGIKQEIGFAIQREVGIHGLNTIWHNITATTHFTLAGLVGSPIILLLLVYWLLIAKTKEKNAIFFLIFFSLFAIPFIFGDQQIQSRFYFEIPVQIPAAIALMTLRERTGPLIPIAICLWLIVMSVYMTVNFILVIH